MLSGNWRNNSLKSDGAADERPIPIIHSCSNHFVYRALLSHCQCPLPFDLYSQFFFGRQIKPVLVERIDLPFQRAGAPVLIGGLIHVPSCTIRGLPVFPRGSEGGNASRSILHAARAESAPPCRMHCWGREKIGHAVRDQLGRKGRTDEYTLD